LIIFCPLLLLPRSEKVQVWPSRTEPSLADGELTGQRDSFSVQWLSENRSERNKQFHLGYARRCGCLGLLSVLTDRAMFLLAQIAEKSGDHAALEHFVRNRGCNFGDERGAHLGIVPKKYDKFLFFQGWRRFLGLLNP
jgi:hypothetical protein